MYQMNSMKTALLFVLTLGLSGYTADAGLLYHHTLDEATGTTAADSQGNDDGVLTTASGTFTFDEDGIAGNVGTGALNFTASEENRVVLENDALMLGTIDFAIEMMVKRSSDGATAGLWGAFSTASGAAGAAWARIQSNNTVRFLFDEGGTAVFADSAGTITADDQWHSLKFERIGATMNIYIDGGLDGTTTGGGVFDVSGDDGAFYGGYIPTGTAGFDGAIDEFRVSTLIVPAPAALPAGLLAMGLLAARRRR